MGKSPHDKFDQHHRWARYFIKAVFALMILMLASYVAAGVWLVNNPEAIGEFIGQIVEGIETGYEEAR